MNKYRIRIDMVDARNLPILTIKEETYYLRYNTGRHLEALISVLCRKEESDNNENK